jgi:hypothetical protein
VYAATDYAPRSAEERDLCERASDPDWLYMGGLLALNAGAVFLDNSIFKYGGGGSGVRLTGASISGFTWGGLVTGMYLSLPKCNPRFVDAPPPEGAVRSRLPLAIALSTLAVATAPFFVYIYTGPVPTDWTVSERSMRVIFPMITGLAGSIVPYLEFLAPKTWRSAMKLERIRLQSAPVPPGADLRQPPAGFFVGYTAQF